MTIAEIVPIAAASPTSSGNAASADFEEWERHEEEQNGEQDVGHRDQSEQGCAAHLVEAGAEVGNDRSADARWGTPRRRRRERSEPPDDERSDREKQGLRHDERFGAYEASYRTRRKGAEEIPGDRRRRAQREEAFGLPRIERRRRHGPRERHGDRARRHDGQPGQRDREVRRPGDGRSLAMSAPAMPMRIAGNSRPRRTRPSAAPYPSDATNDTIPSGRNRCGVPRRRVVRRRVCSPRLRRSATGFECGERGGDEDRDGPLGRADASGGRDTGERRGALLVRDGTDRSPPRKDDAVAETTRSSPEQLDRYRLDGRHWGPSQDDDPAEEQRTWRR